MSKEIQEQVNSIVDQMIKDDDGKWTLPEEVSKDLDDTTMFAVTAERRFRDTQAGYTQTRQQLKRQESVSQALQEKILSSGIELSPEQTQELNTLRTSDPEAWRNKLNEYEAQAKDNLKGELEEIAKQAGDKTELEIRGEQMAAWSESTGIELNDDIVKDELPPKLTRQLSEGEITFQQFLEKAGEYLSKDRVIAGAEKGDEEEEPSFTGKVGGAEPTSQAEEGDLAKTYEKTIF